VLNIGKQLEHREPPPLSGRGLLKTCLLEVVGTGVELAGYGVAPVLGHVGVEDLRGASLVGHRLDHQRLARYVGYDAISGVLGSLPSQGLVDPYAFPDDLLTALCDVVPGVSSGPIRARATEDGVLGSIHGTDIVVATLTVALV
jgi:hypothetical protein